MRRRALLSGLLLGGLAALSGALAVRPLLDLPLDLGDDGEKEQPPPTEPLPPETPPGEPDDEEAEPTTEPA